MSASFDGRLMFFALATAFLAATTDAASPHATPMTLRTRSSPPRMQTNNWYAQGQPQQQPPQQQQQPAVRWHLTPANGGVLGNYAMTIGDEPLVLGRFDMHDQKLTVSRMQCVVEVGADGTAVVSSLGKRPTGLRRHNNAPWYGLSQGYHVLVDGEQIALDMDSGESFGYQGQPYTAIFTAYKEGGSGGGMGAAAARASRPLPYPWVQLMDPNGRVYYSNQQTGVATWDPRIPYYPQQGYDSV